LPSTPTCQLEFSQGKISYYRSYNEDSLPVSAENFDTFAVLV
jgi:hypothetical protein